MIMVTKKLLMYNLDMPKGKNTLLTFFARSKPYRYAPGEAILRADDTPSGVYWIEKGFVKVYSITEEGNEKLHIIYKTGELFPLIWVFSNVTKDVFYEAFGEVVLRRSSKEEFLAFLKTSCTNLRGCSLLFELVERVIDLLDVHIDRVDNLEITKAYPRLVAMLLHLAKRFGRKEGKSIKIDIRLTHSDIANSVNMTRETASREMERLQRKGLIKYQVKLIIIKNIEELKEELSAHYERKLL